MTTNRNLIFSFSTPQPEIIIVSPLNNTNVTYPSNITITLNWSIQDQQNNTEVWVWASNDSINLYDYLVFHRKGLQNGSYNYNWTAQGFRQDGNTVLLLHFDNLTEQQENGTFVKDFSLYANNGTVQNGSWNETGGMFAGAYELDGRLPRSNISVND